MKKAAKAKKVRHGQYEKKLFLLSVDRSVCQAHLFGIGKAMAVSISNNSKTIHMSFTVVSSSMT